MAAREDDPLAPVREGVTALRDMLQELIRSALKKTKPMVRQILKFLSKLKSQAQALIGAIGRSAYSQIIGMADRLAARFPLIEKLANSALKFANQILAMIKKAVDPTKIFRALKRLVGRLVSMFRTIFSFVKELIQALDPIGRVLALIAKFVMVLRAIISWITDVSGVLTAVKKVQSILRKCIKTLMRGLKEATKLAKTTNALKAA